MTDKKEITGWVAWHPEKGADPLSFADNEEEPWSIVVNEGPYGINYECLEDYEFAVYEAKKNGWRIRPVKLVFTDEGEK